MSVKIAGLMTMKIDTNGQNHWIRKLVANVIDTRNRLSDESIANLYRLFLREKELAEGGPPNVEPLTTSRVPAIAPTTMWLASLEHIENVNALAGNQEIKFNRHLTVCFGENGSGKTGYVRILKRAAGVRTAEPILMNIHANESGRPPLVKFNVFLGDEERIIDWQGQPGIEPLTRVDVFDARSAVVHLANDLTYSYTPSDLSLFPLVTDGIDRVQNRIQTAKEEREQSKNPFESLFSREGRLHKTILGLGPTTDLQELEALAQMSEEEEAGITGLREKVSALRAGSVRSQIEGTSQEIEILAEILSIAETTSAFDTDSYQEAISGARTARANHERATREALAGQNVPGILGEAWREFIEAAEGYIREVGTDPYPEPGTPCIYCRQPLNDAAAELIQKYRDYCNAALRQAVDQADARIRTLCTAVTNLRIDDTERNVNRLLQGLADPSNPPPALEAAQEVIQYARHFHQVITAEEDHLPTFDVIQHARDTVRATVETAKTTLVDLRKQGEERERVLSEEQTNLLELEARLKLRDLMPDIKKHVEVALWAVNCARHLQSFQGTKRSLTNTAKRASTEVMDQKFQELFSEECQSLRAPEVRLDFPGREGQARRRKLLTLDHGLSEILSEGEQKVIALADFLAEATLKPDRSPIVLDDPVTSLDHKRLQHVVDRLVKLSVDRQVIVFTHDIWFAAELLGRFDKERSKCAFYDVTVEDQRIGLAIRGSHPRTDTFTNRAGYIKAQIEQAEKETGEKRLASIEKGYEELRGACEVVVEKDLLQGVTERYRPNVRMTVLDQIRSDRLPDAIQNIVPIFDKCCRIIASHSQPIVTRGVRPTLDELKCDWNTLQGTRNEYLRN